MAFVLHGCGYRLAVRPTESSALGQLRLGSVTDHTVDGRLGLRVIRTLRARLGGEEGPLSVEATIHPLASSPLAFDRAVALSECGVQLRIRLRHDDGRIYWDSGPIAEAVACLRVANPSADPRAALQRGRSRALDSALDTALSRLVTARAEWAKELSR